jgi:hypothetical protein
MVTVVPSLVTDQLVPAKLSLLQEQSRPGENMKWLIPLSLQSPAVVGRQA